MATNNEDNVFWISRFCDALICVHPDCHINIVSLSCGLLLYWLNFSGNFIVLLFCVIILNLLPVLCVLQTIHLKCMSTFSSQAFFIFSSLIDMRVCFNTGRAPVIYLKIMWGCGVSIYGWYAHFCRCSSITYLKKVNLHGLLLSLLHCYDKPSILTAYIA